MKMLCVFVSVRACAPPLPRTPGYERLMMPARAHVVMLPQPERHHPAKRFIYFRQAYTRTNTAEPMNMRNGIGGGGELLWGWGVVCFGYVRYARMCAQRGSL